MKDLTLLMKMAPILNLIPEVKQSSYKLTFKNKILWTGITLFIYLICCQIPLYGVLMSSLSDPLHYMRVILASNRGTLMELGISPLITSNMVIELLANTKIISFNSSNDTERRLLGKMEKLLSFIVAFSTSFIYVWSGMYGDIRYIGTFKAFSIVIQLTLSGIMVIYLDELPQKGYGIGSGVSLFIATNICETIIWKSLSPTTFKTSDGIEFEGIIISFFHFLFTKKNVFVATKLAFFRSNLPNLNNLLATVFIFLIVIYLQNLQVNLPLKSREKRGLNNTFPIKLFYLSNTPLILQTALISNLHVISSLLYKKFKGFSLIRLLGVWKENQDGTSTCVGGLAFYLTPPNSLSDIIFNPGHFFVYSFIIIISCALFSKFWLELSGRSSRDILKQFNQNKIKIGNYQEKSMIVILNKFIPIAAILGGILIAILSIFSDLLGCIGSGTGLLLLVNIIYNYFEEYKKEEKNKIKSIIKNY